MFYLRLIGTALRSLESHFLRSLLATLGVLIGVASVVASMSILEGATNQILGNLKSLGSNVLYVHPAQARIEGRAVGMAQTLVVEDMEQLLRELPDDISAIAPQAFDTVTVKHFRNSEPATVVATSDVFFSIHGFETARGRVFTPSETYDELATVVLLGSKIAEKLFGGSDPVGQTLKVGSAPYRIIGVLEKRGTLGFLNADETVYIPIKAGLKRFFNRTWLNRLTIEGQQAGNLKELERKVTRVLRRAHNIRIGEEDDFNLFTQEQVLEQYSQTSMIFRVIFYSIAGISLIVGGIGIMNIMLVSVTERTREIGVRMAVGARRGDIMLQFLVEALIVSLLGGGFGLLLGAMFSDLMENVMVGEMRTEITSVVIVTALVTSTLVGVFSGLYPAFKASRLDPVEALRYE